jgi:4-carboxymuconolactone decarboxylase
MTSTRLEKGLDVFTKITGLSREASRKGLNEISPELSDWILEFAYGEVLSRKQLDLKSRQLATVAALTAMGTAPGQLRAHIKGAINVGCSQSEVVEVILQMAVYAGFPAALNGIEASREVFDSLNVENQANKNPKD